jgi:epoxyqueuosine reductase
MLDARRCISYLTIEKKGVLTTEERGMLGAWIFGCDVCQDVCPFNHKSLAQALPPERAELGFERGVGAHLSLSEVLSLRTHEAFSGRFAGTPLMRAGRESLIRNACAVAVNIGARETLPNLTEAFQSDSSAVVRRHALWAAARLFDGHQGDIAALYDRGLADPDEGVRSEAAALVEGVALEVSME